MKKIIVIVMLLLSLVIFVYRLGTVEMNVFEMILWVIVWRFFFQHFKQNN